MITPTMTPMMMPTEPLFSTAAGGGGEGGGGARGGGGGGAWQVKTVPKRPSPFTVGQEQTAVPALAAT